MYIESITINHPNLIDLYFESYHFLLLKIKSVTYAAYPNVLINRYYEEIELRHLIQDLFNLLWTGEYRCVSPPGFQPYHLCEP